MIYSLPSFTDTDTDTGARKKNLLQSTPFPPFPSMQRQDQSSSNHRPKRKPRPPTTIIVHPGNVAFRVICHCSIIGGVIGKSGSIISQIKRHTFSFIHCDNPVPDSDHRIIVVVGSAARERTILLQPSASGGGEVFNGDDAATAEEVLVSGAQEALIRVLERMWQVDGERGGGGGGGDGEGEDGDMEGYCGLLVNTTQIGAIVGRGGKCIVKMRRDSGAEIRILPAPHCADKDDELIQITGTFFSVKKALAAVTSILQDCLPCEKDPIPFTRPVDRTSQRDTSDPHAEFFPHLCSLLPTNAGNSASADSSLADAKRDLKQEPPEVPETMTNHKEVSFRFLCSSRAAGSVIGAKGTIVRALQNETGASIMFAAPQIMCNERVVTISALENLESWHSPAQNAVVLVFARSVEYDIEKMQLPDSIKCAAVTARLLVASDVACCLRKGEDRIDPEIAETTGADIQILERDRALDFASGNDVIVQITGEYLNVQNALFKVTGELRDNLLPNDMLTEERERYQRMRETTRLQKPSGHSDQETSLTRGMDQLRLSNSTTDPFLPELMSPEKLGKRCAEIITDNGCNSKTFGPSPQLERSLHFLLPREVLNEVGDRNTNGGLGETSTSGLHSSSYPTFSSAKGNNRFGVSKNINGASPGPRLSQTGGRGNALMDCTRAERSSTTFEGSVGTERMKPAVVASVNVELTVSKLILDSLLYGEDGNNLARFRQISGAKVEVRYTSAGKCEGVIVISGTLEQTMAAQKLLDAFIKGSE